MPTREWNIANNIVSAFTDGIAYIPQDIKFDNIPFGNSSVETYFLGINIPDDRENKNCPFINPVIQDKISNHTIMGLKVYDNIIKESHSEFQNIIAESPGGSVWIPEFGFYVNQDKEFCIIVKGWDGVIGRYSTPSSFRGAIEAISFAFKMSSCGPARQWRYMERKEIFEAADPASAALIGTSLFSSNHIRAMWNGKHPSPPRIYEVFDEYEIMNAVALRRAENAELILPEN